MARLLYSAAVNAARMAALQVEVGSDPIMRLYGLNQGEAVPLTCEAAAEGFVIAEGADTSGAWLGVPSSLKTPDFVARTNLGGGGWDLTISDSGVIAYGRIYDSTGTFCCVQFEVRDVSEMLPPVPGPGPDDETGVFGGERFEPGCVYVDGKVIDSTQLGHVISLDEATFTAGNQARYVDV